MVQPLSRGGKPRSKAVLHPVPWPKQNDAGGLQEEHAKVAIAAFGQAVCPRRWSRIDREEQKGSQQNEVNDSL